MPDSKFLRKLWTGDPLENWTNAHLDRRRPSKSLTGALEHLARIGQALGQMKDPPEQLRELVAQRRDQFTRLQARSDFGAKMLGWAEQGLQLIGKGRETTPPKRGRPQAPGMAEASADVTRIVTLWKTTFKKNLGVSITHQSPSALEIAARRHGVDPDQLENFRKNQNLRKNRHRPRSKK